MPEVHDSPNTWVAWHRRLVRDHERRPASAQSWVYWAMTGTDRLRAMIAELSAQLDRAQRLAEQFQLTRQRLLEVAESESEPDHEPGDDQPQPIDTLPSAGQEILGVLAGADGGLRAKDRCRALDIGDRPRHAEALRAKLKRLVGRDILTEPEPGLFTLNRGAGTARGSPPAIRCS